MAKDKGDDEPLGKFSRDAALSYLGSMGRNWKEAEPGYRGFPTWLGLTYSLLICALFAAMALAVVDGQHREAWILTLLGLMVMLLLGIVEAMVRRKEPR